MSNSLALYLFKNRDDNIQDFKHSLIQNVLSNITALSKKTILCVFTSREALLYNIKNYYIKITLSYIICIFLSERCNVHRKYCCSVKK